MARKRLEKSAWFPVPELGFEMLIRYVPLPEMARQREAATQTRRDPRSLEFVERLSQEKFAEILAGAILDWRALASGESGLPLDIYGRLIPIDPVDYPEPIPCEEEFKMELLREARGFATVVLDLCTDLARYQQEQAKAELKN